MADNYTALKSAQKKRYISKETFNSLDLSQIPVGSEYEVVSPIEKGDLSADINNALNKAENALPKPTNDTTGSAGQVLKKTANGSEWGDAPSGGGKLYKHLIDFQFADSRYTNEYRIRFVVYGATSEEANTISKFKNLYDTHTPTCIIDTKGGDAVGVGYLTNLLDDSSYPELHGYLGSWTPVNTAFTNIYISDTVTEL